MGRQVEAVGQPHRMGPKTLYAAQYRATILITGIGGNLALTDGLFPFNIPVIFPKGIPAIVFAAIVGILLQVIFLVLPPSMFGVKDRENIKFQPYVPQSCGASPPPRTWSTERSQTQWTQRSLRSFMKR
jgi:hypothetical protein